MKNKIKFNTIMLLIWSVAGFSQTAHPINKTKYKIVFQLASGDTVVHRSTIIQLNNALAEAPNSKIEVVCHNAGISFLQQSKTTVAKDIMDLKNRGVVFAACENTLRMRKIEKTDIVSEAIFVHAGVIELADKQNKGWAYLKAGN